MRPMVRSVVRTLAFSLLMVVFGNRADAAPVISSLSPTSGMSGTPVTISGTGFGTTQGTSTVKFGGVTATVNSWSASTIVALVPPGVGTIQDNILVQVTVGGVGSNQISFVVTNALLYSILPSTGPVGASITLSGANFGTTQGSSIVKFGSAVAQIISWSANTIVAVAPAVISGSVNVQITVGGVGSATVPYTVSNNPFISGLSSNSAPTNTEIAIYGVNFGSSQGNSTVTVNGTSSIPSFWSSTSITISIPEAATTGNIKVTVNGVASNGYAFMVTPPGHEGGVGFVQGNYSTTATCDGQSTSMVIPFPIEQNPGDLNVIIANWRDTNPLEPAVAGDMVNTGYYQARDTQQSGNGHQKLWFLSNIVGSSNSVLVSFYNCVVAPEVIIAEYKGISPTAGILPGLDAVTSKASSGSTTCNSGSVTTTSANDLLVGASLAGKVTTTPGTSFTNRVITTPAGDMLEDRIVTATGSYSAGATMSASGSCIMGVMAFEELPNQAPVVSAGPNQSTSPPNNSVTLAGVATDDGLPNNTLTTTWSKVSGPGTVTFGSPSNVVSQATFSTAGTYVLQLTANDSQLSGSGTTTITVGSNQAPQVNAGPDQTIALPVNSVILNGTATDDGFPNGSLTALWAKLNGPGTVTFSSPNTAITQATFSAAGAYVLQLTVSDSQLASSDTVNVTVNPSAGPATMVTLTATRTKTVNVPGRTAPWLFSSTFNSVYSYADSGITAPVAFPVAAGEQATWKYLNGAMSLGPGWSFTDAAGQPGDTSTPSHPGRFIPGPPIYGGALMGAWTDSAGQLVALPFAINNGATVIAPPATTVAQIGVNDLFYNDNAGSWNIKFQAGFPGASTISGTNVTGSVQNFVVFVTQGGVGVSGATVQFTVAGANSQTATATTGADGSASFSYTGTHSGVDSVQATAVSLSSNTVSVPWITPLQSVSTSTAVGKFFIGNGSCAFNTPGTAIPDFVQEFPTINFNPPAGTIPGNTSGVDINTLPFTDITTDSNGNFVGTSVAQGNGYQAGNSPMGSFQSAFTGAFTVGAAGNVTFNFFAERSFIFGIGNSATGASVTRVSGPLTGAPASGLTSFTGLPVVGALNDGTTSGAAGQTVVVSFPGAGIYPYELDYAECGGSPLTLTMAVGQSSSIGVAPSGYLRLSPGAPHARTTGDTETVTVEAHDATGAPVPNLGVGLIVKGVNPQQLSSTTNASGQTTLSYVGGVVPGTDLMQAVANIGNMLTVSNTSTIFWNPPGGVITYVFTPQGWIASPLIGTIVQSQVPITLVSGISVASGTLTYWPMSDPAQVHTLNGNVTGTGPLTLGTFDASTLPNGQYTIRLDAIASTGAAQRNEIVVTVMGDNKPGRVTTTVTDLKVPLAGMPINISRTYDSLERFNSSDFGFGWKLSTNMNLEVDRLKNVTFAIDGRRRTFFFAPKSSGSPLFSWFLVPNWVPQAGLHGMLAQEGGCGDLVQIDGDVVCALGGDFVPTTYIYTDPAGRAYKIASTGELQSIKDLNGVTLTFGANGILSSAGGVVVPFIRDTQGRITQIADLAGNQYNYAYDNAGNLASVFLPGTTAPTSYTYSSDHLLLSSTDARGNSTSATYYADGRLQSVTNAAGTTQYSYNPATNTTTTTFPDGGAQTETDNSFGKPLSITDSLNRTTVYTYDTSQNMLTMTNPLGKIWTYTYDANGFQTSVKDPLNHTRSTGYNQFGGPTSIVDALGNTTTVTYDLQTFNPIHADDSLGQLFAATYDAAGNPLTSIDANGKTTQFVYDVRGNLTQKTDPLNRVTSYTYDSMDRVLTETDPRQHTTTYAYDALGRLTSKKNALNQVTTFTYDNNGNKLTETDALNHQTSYQYDALNRLTRITYPDNTIRLYTYDFRSNKLTETDQSGRVTQYQYDLVGQLTQVTYALGTPEAGSVQYTYDSAGRRKTVKDERNNTTTYNYDDAGRLTSMVDAMNHTTGYNYDAADRLIKTVNNALHADNYTLDARNRMITFAHPDFSALHYTYDGVGHQLTITDEAGKVTTKAYDNAGQLASVTDALSHTTQYAYDLSGNLTAITDANGHITSFQYDNLNRRTQRLLPLSQTERNAYDAVGNVSGHTDFNGKTTTFTYDTVNRLLSKIPDTSLGQPTVTFTYNLTGKRATMVDGTGTTTYSYDHRDRLTSKATPQGALSYTYDAHGNVLTIVSSNANGASATYTYNALNQLATVVDNRLLAQGVSPATTSYGYNGIANLASYTYPNGVVTNYAYDGLDRLKQVSSSKGSALSNFTYTLGTAGNRTAVSDLGGRTVNYGYDDVYRLTSEAITADPGGNNGTISYVYDLVGNRTQRNSTLSAVPTATYSYDANDRIGGDTFDSNGNTISSAGISFAYDFEDRLTLRGAVTIAYDGDGNRVLETAGGVTTNYLVDTLNPTGYSQVVDEIVNGSVTRTYAYGLARISEDRLVGSTWTPSFYGYDAHMNVRFLANTPGSVTDTYQFDAFGTQIAATGTTSNSYLFSAERWDQNISLYHLRARYYNVLTGRFETIDPNPGDISDPRTLHKYVYAANNSVNLSDPQGTDFVENAILSSKLAEESKAALQVGWLAARTICYTQNLVFLSVGIPYWVANGHAPPLPYPLAAVCGVIGGLGGPPSFGGVP